MTDACIYISILRAYTLILDATPTHNEQLIYSKRSYTYVYLSENIKPMCLFNKNCSLYVYLLIPDFVYIRNLGHFKDLQITGICIQIGHLSFQRFAIFSFLHW